MPATLSLSNLTWSLPDGTPLFSELSLNIGAERTGLIGRNGSGKSTLLNLIAGNVPMQFGQLRRPGTIGLMRQNAAHRPDETIADLFGVAPALDLLDQAEAGQADMDDLAQADWTLPARLETALRQCGLEAEPRTRLHSLSGGQRTRAQLAALIFAKPDFLLLDEPTNNLDQSGRETVRQLVRDWKKGALIVSHDRALLEEMDAIVELTSLGATRYGGNYSTFLRIKEIERDAARRDLAQAEKTHALRRRRAQQAAIRKARKDAAGHRARARNDQPKSLLDAAKERAEASGGADARLRTARVETAREALTAARDKVEVIEPLRMDIPETGMPAGRTVLRMENVNFGHAPGAPVVQDFSLAVTGPERIALAGPNGSGKTTLLKLVTGALRPEGGSIDLSVPYALLNQHDDVLDPSLSLRDNILALTGRAGTRTAHEVLACFGFRASDGLRMAAGLSGGERVRANLACAIGAMPTPQLLILDEPTNHLDLDGIEALESALAAHDGALLVVSHDEAFLEKIALDRIVRLPK